MFRHFAVSTLSASLSVFAGVCGAATPAATTAVSHVRPTDPRLQEALQVGLTQSPTFRGLVQALDASDVIVYPSLTLGRPGLRGYLVHSLTIAGPNRYLRVVLSVRMTDTHLVAVLAHELQHAVEVAEATHVRSAPELRTFFEQVGFRTGRSHTVETRAALLVQARVRRELRQGRSPITGRGTVD
jgi:hypothetical protein